MPKKSKRMDCIEATDIWRASGMKGSWSNPDITPKFTWRNLAELQTNVIISDVPA
jgi:hypothetical protein